MAGSAPDHGDLHQAPQGAGVPLNQRAIEEALRALLAERGTATACPSEIARALSKNDWRTLMPAVRAVAARLQDTGEVDVFQRGRPVNAREARGPIRLRLRAAALVDYRARPEQYRSGRGEQGVLTIEPYKSELLPLWRFRTPAIAAASAKALWAAFGRYRAAGDFVGMDMTRKFVQMGFTRARRYANHAGGRKYGKGTRTELPREPDPEKARSAAIFKKVLDRLLRDRTYRRLRALHAAP